MMDEFLVSREILAAPVAMTRDLYEVRIALASRYLIVRVRETDADHAKDAVLAHHPGWDHVETHRWAGEGWVRA